MCSASVSFEAYVGGDSIINVHNHQWVDAMLTIYSNLEKEKVQH
jgi:hypothetical protein